MCLCVEIDKLILKFTGKCQGARIAKIIFEKEHFFSFLMFCWIQFANIVLKFFASRFVRDTGP